MASSPLERAAEAFATALTHWRSERGMSKKRLATEMGFDPSYVSHVEGRRHRPTEDFARRAEAVLRAGGAIWQRYAEYDDLRSVPRVLREPHLPEHRLPPGAGLVVEQEVASLTFRDGVYHCSIRRDLYNAGADPVTRYPVRISVDRYPNDPDRSNRHYREHPLTWEEMRISAYCGEEPMDWRALWDRDSFKELWLLFENDHARFPLYPGQRTSIEYSYQVGEDKWGQWFQRSIRVPTRRLRIDLDLPAEYAPTVWGTETSLTAEAATLRTPLTRAVRGDSAVFGWETENPPLHARYRLEWRYRAKPAKPSERMRAAGILQRGNDALRQPVRLFALPGDAAIAREALRELRQALEQVGTLHSFGKGLGLAGPQIGLAWAAAVVVPSPTETVDPGSLASDAAVGVRPRPGVIELLNPRVVAEAAEQDEHYEGCLSFFDVRGIVRRPMWIEVEHTSLAGNSAITRFERGLARLVAHEIDHLNGRLYVDRMAPGVPLVPVEAYREAGRPWTYTH